ncbi:unnamed protein product [Calypogeia fissa]
MASDKFCPKKQQKEVVVQETDMELLPGIPDDLTLDFIVPKLPLTLIDSTLSCVSPGWRRAVRSSWIFAARARSCLTETLLLINHTRRSDDINADDTNAISLYSLRDKLVHHLPPIPGVKCGIPWSCNCVTMGGKIYVLGGLKNPNQHQSHPGVCSGNVYVLDMVGERTWKRCATMLKPRERFGCSTFNGKILVCGGLAGISPITVSEMYDPEADAWTAVSPMPIMSWRCDHQVGILGDELLVFSGRSTSNVVFGVDKDISCMEESIRQGCMFYCVFGVEVYNPTKDEWRSIRTQRDFGWTLSVCRNRFFAAHGKLHALTEKRIFRYDFEKKKAEKLQLSRLPFSLPHRVAQSQVHVVDDELVMIGWSDSRYGGNEYPACILHGKNFRLEDKEILWSALDCPFSFWGRFSFTCSLQL